MSSLSGSDPLLILVGAAGIVSMAMSLRALRRAIIERSELERSILAGLPRSTRRRPVSATSWESLKVAREHGDIAPEDVRVRGRARW